MQPRVKQKRALRGDGINSVILKILILLMASLIVNCSSPVFKGKSHARQLKAGDYFGGTSAGFWPPKNYVPPEIKNKAARISEAPGVDD